MELRSKFFRKPEKAQALMTRASESPGIWRGFSYENHCCSLRWQVYWNCKKVSCRVLNPERNKKEKHYKILRRLMH
ncbi:hypothetical protein GQ472_04045 [archaeon]|nr:hypothetical protein [archaeon]